MPRILQYQSTAFIPQIPVAPTLVVLDWLTQPESPYKKHKRVFDDFSYNIPQIPVAPTLVVLDWLTQPERLHKKHKRVFDDFSYNIPVDLFATIPASLGYAFYTRQYTMTFWGSHIQTGEFLRTGIDSSNTAIASADTIYYMPIIIPYSMKVDRISYNLSSSNPSAQTRMGIYGVERGIVGQKVTESDIVTTVLAGIRTATIDAFLQPGMYCCAFQSDTDLTLLLVGADDNNLLGFASETSTPFLVYEESQAFASGLPVVASANKTTSGAFDMWIRMV